MKATLDALTGFGLFATPVLIVAGQLLFKQAGIRLAASERKDLLQVIFDPYLLIAFGIYGIGTLLWVYVLARLPLARAYPIMALTYVLVPIGSILIFDDTIVWTYWVGAGLIILGVAVMFAST